MDEAKKKTTTMEKNALKMREWTNERTTMQKERHKMLTEKLLWHFSEWMCVFVSLSQCNDIEL